MTTFRKNCDGDDDSSIRRIIATLKWGHKAVYEVTYFIVFYVIWLKYDLFRDINFNLQFFSRIVFYKIFIYRKILNTIRNFIIL